MEDLKTCSKCKEAKPRSHFWKYKAAKDGLNWWCKVCYRPASPRPEVSYGRKGKPVSELPGGRAFVHFNYTFVYETLRMARMRCDSHGRVCDLTMEDVFDYFHNFCENNYFEMTPKSPFKPSLDRLDNSIGYVKGNVRACWMIENYCKNTFTDEQVIEFCKRKLGLY